MNSHGIYIVVILMACIGSVIYGRQWRIDQIPNGHKFSCANCHIDPLGGGPRNKFGQAVEALVAPGSTQEFWGPELAKFDSDGDGFSNGAELGDPNGTWRAGQPNPGDVNQVSNPGDINSRPNMTDVKSNSLVSTYKLYSNYPNPFNPSTTIMYEIPKNEMVTITIFNVLGQPVRTLVNDYMTAGRHSDVWNGRDDTHSELATGIYICKLTAGNFSQAIRMVLLK